MIGSSKSFGAGPIPSVVIVPGSSCVNPASWMRAVGNPFASAVSFILSSSSRLFTLTTIFF